ncbi:MAG TPA: chloride channel protein [Devosia sp.]|uniref:chloride channel protein n=1 Tax=Devosia sp. TaxID=1871048 RepID=UPI002DDDB982|nr:chloride channel protein [Devosia sp.]HEV2516898.1 chloride channel protein [Devosia sp.]
MNPIRSKELLQTLRRRGATLTGAIAIGLLALVFAFAADAAQRLFTLLAGSFSLLPLLITPLGFAALVYLTRRFAPDARGSGVPQVIAAAQLPHPELSPLISLRTAIAKLLLTLGGLMLGASSGREGPTVQLSAAAMTATHRLFRVPLSSAVVIAGGAAGVSAAFNTPLAGITFALEELAAAYEQRLTLLVMAAVVVAGLVSLGIAGDYLYFGAMNDTMTLAAGLLTVPVVAAIGGAAGALFSRLVLFAANGVQPLLRPIREHPILFAAGCGLVVALIGTATGLTWGTGYEPAKILIEGGTQPVWFAPAKFLATLATSVSGLPGGVFAPSLSVGAGLGGLLSPLFSVAPPATVVAVGMTAYFVGVVRAPLTSVVIIMEMTGSHAMLLALITAAIIAEGVAAVLCPERLYHGLSKAFRQAPTARRDTTPAD